MEHAGISEPSGNSKTAQLPVCPCNQIETPGRNPSAISDYADARRYRLNRTIPQPQDDSKTLRRTPQNFIERSPYTDLIVAFKHLSIDPYRFTIALVHCGAPLGSEERRGNCR